VWAIWRLYQTRRQHTTATNLMVQYKVFFSRWRPERWYWGFIFTLRQQLLALSLMVAGDDVFSQLMWVSTILLLHSCLLCVLMPWRIQEMNVFEIIAVILLLILVNCAGAFVGQTTKTDGFEFMMVCLVVVAFATIAIAVARVAIAVALGGPKSVYVGHPKTVDLKTLCDTIQMLCSLNLTEETTLNIAKSFTEADRRVLVNLVHVFQTGSVNALEFPVQPKARIFVPCQAFATPSDRESFAKQIKTEVSNSKLESYI